MTPESVTIPCDPGPMPALVWAPHRRATGVCLLAHGRNGAADTPHMTPISAAYLARGWAVVAPHLGESAANPGHGDGTGFTLAGLVRDLRAALAWTRARFDVPVAVAGHSAGAYGAARLAGEDGPVAHLLGVAPVVSGAALLAARAALGPGAIAALRAEAPRAVGEWPSHDARPALAAFSGPAGVIVGARDGLTPPADARAFFAAAPDGRFFAVLAGQDHCPSGAPFRDALDAALAALIP